ncbi:MAG: FecR domain-containing protein [Rhodocyclales bacterium]|nr:FecR domain-containing protein [Rhodocyclales bacterium]
MIERICMRPSNLLFAVLASLALSLSAPAVFAAATLAPATVEAVQSPAWRDREGVTVPLTPGMELKSGDVLRTGQGARVYLMLAEGSRVKLGEGARFTFHTRSLQPQKSFRGALDILEGAFRFTTGKFKKTLPRDLSIRVATATIGIRGTDLWGRTDSTGELVALLEGRIEITRAGEVTELSQPMTYFDAPRGQAAAVKTLDPGVFRQLSRQTEIEAGDGAARAKGKWRVLAATATSEEGALELYDRLREAGFAARIRPRQAQAEGRNYELLLGGFSSADEAAVAAARLKAVTGLKPSVVR